MSEHGKEHMFETFEQRPGRSPKPLKVQKVVKQVSALPQTIFKQAPSNAKRRQQLPTDADLYGKLNKYSYSGLQPKQVRGRNQRRDVALSFDSVNLLMMKQGNRAITDLQDPITTRYDQYLDESTLKCEQDGSYDGSSIMNMTADHSAHASNHNEYNNIQSFRTTKMGAHLSSYQRG